MSTMKDIAKLAGCSLGTVDRALNNKPGVSEKTRKRILNIAASLQYKPNKVGQRLVLQSKRIRLGVILQPMENPFFQHIRDGVEKAAEALQEEGIITSIYCMNTYKDIEMCALLDYLEESGVSGVVLNGINSPLVREKLEQMHEKGIRIVTCSSDIDIPFRNAFVGFPHEKSGRLAAELLTKLSSQDGTFLVLIGHKNILAHRDRLKGFTEKLAESYPKARIAEVIEVMEDDEIAMKETFSALSKHPEISGIYATCYSISGVLNALRLQRPGVHTPFVCYDRSPAVRQAIREGMIDASICQAPNTQGEKALQILYDYVSNNRSEPTEYLTKVNIRLSENFDD